MASKHLRAVRGEEARVIEVLTIRDLERVSGVPRTTIYYYLRQGLLPRPQKSAASRSLYTEEHVRMLGKIAELKAAGLSIFEIENELQHQVHRANEATVDLAAQEYERTHNRILAVATREFTAQGYKNTHVTTIMRELGITATLFYSHFASKRKLLAECVSVLMNWSLTYGDETTASMEDPAERLLWHVFGHSRVFELGSAALALIRVEGTQNESDLREPVDELLAGTVERISEDFADSATPGSEPPAVPDELVAHSLLGAYEQTVFRSLSDRKYTRKDLLRTHLWLFLAARAARNGEVDIASRLARYEGLISRLASEMPPPPPVLHDLISGSAGDSVGKSGSKRSRQGVSGR